MIYPLRAINEHGSKDERLITVDVRHIAAIETTRKTRYIHTTIHLVGGRAWDFAFAPDHDIKEQLEAVEQAWLKYHSEQKCA